MPSYDSKRLGEIHRELHSHLPSDSALRVKAMESLLVDKGLLDRGAVDAWVEIYADKVGPKNGAAVAARAWCDPDFKARLLADGNAAVAEFDFTGRHNAQVIVVENTPEVHNLVVCTLCSCYPIALLGVPPAWYKANEYRARAVREPRAVLAEFGVVPEPGQKVRVWDSTSEARYMVLPQRPAGTEGLSEAELAALISRNAMIGTAVVEAPTPTSAPGKEAA
ncbi:MAG: nitrile hydratase subunit alpha [Rhodospirillales bacterium]